MGGDGVIREEGSWAYDPGGSRADLRVTSCLADLIWRTKLVLMLQNTFAVMKRGEGTFP